MRTTTACALLLLLTIVPTPLAWADPQDTEEEEGTTIGPVMGTCIDIRPGHPGGPVDVYDC